MSGARKFAFKKSALAEKADKLWSESKSDYAETHQNTNHIQLEKKTLGDVLGKMSAKKAQEDSDGSCSFVFGSKISDRIVHDESTKDAEPASDDSSTKTATELFKSAGAGKADEESNTSRETFREEAVQAAEKAKEVEKQHASTSLVEVTTGEESDENIFQASCKLHGFDKERQQYVEKGVCTLRINRRLENGQTHHRIIARTTGTLRVVINSKIFADMLVERVDRRIKISAMGPESPGVQIFLLKFGFSKTDTGVETEQFYAILSDILKLEKGDQCRKRKADSDLNADNAKLRDAKIADSDEKEDETTEKMDEKSTTEVEDEVEKSKDAQETEAEEKAAEEVVKADSENNEKEGSEEVEDGFVLVEKPTDEEVSQEQS